MNGGGQDAWISDGVCDDLNNNLFCQFDGGDCCGHKVRKQYCITCECLGKFALYTFFLLCSFMILPLNGYNV